MTDHGEKKGTATEVTVGELLREDVDRELDQRGGEWSSFTASVFRKIDEVDVTHARLSADQQAIEHLKASVDTELQEMAPQFEEAFRQGVEKRIWRSAREGPSFFRRIWDRLSPQPIGWGLGWAAAAVAVLLLVLIPLNPSPPAVVQSAGEQLVGRVEVERLSFEGTVTLSPTEGVTVIWLSDATS